MTEPYVRLWRDYLTQARWFQGKGLPIGEIAWRVLPWHTRAGDVWVRSELPEIVIGEVRETYHLLAGYLPAGTAEPDALVGQTELAGRGLVDVVDAPRSTRAMAALLEALAQPDSPGMTWFDAAPDPHSPTAVFTGEQSNTTVQVGEDLQFKVFRKIAIGQNLEATMLAALRRSGITPRLVGTLTTAGGDINLGVFIQRIRDARDGWDYCVQACQAERPIMDEMTRLGATLRSLHADLAQAFGSSTVDGGTLGRQMLARLKTACAQTPELADKCPSLRAVFDLHDMSVPIQRVHGDFHLGQALISPDGWTIIDFEGEPLKTPEERAAPDSPWRDVAGLLRSLDYARHYHPEPDSPSAMDWYDDARRALLDGYRGGQPVPATLLRAYEIDKAVYELVYETRNRPTWAPIPRHAIDEAIAGLPTVTE